jgi:RHS repeat-associated protein/uncharacterized repeat protein (TIGR01451 family)
VLNAQITGTTVVAAGTDAVFPIVITNSGSETATDVHLTTALTGPGTAALSAVPSTLAPGASVTVTATVPTSAELTASLELLVTTTWSQAGSAPGLYGPIEASKTVVSRPPVAMEFTKVATDPALVPAGQIEYGLSLRNTGTSPQTNVVIDDPIDPQAQIVQASITLTPGYSYQSGYFSSDRSVHLTYATINPGDTVFISFRVDHSAAAAGTTRIVNQAQVHSDSIATMLSDDPTVVGFEDPTITPISVTPPPPGGTGGTGGLPGPTAANCTPADGDTVTAPTTIACTLTPRPGVPLADWTVTVRPVGTAIGGPEDRPLGTGTGTTVTAPLDPTLLDNGQWIIAIEAKGTDGGQTITETGIVIDGQLKLGRFSQTFEDLKVPVGGIPVQVTRTYDSFTRNHPGDFGNGWTLGVSDFRVQTNRPLGDGPWTKKDQCIPYPQFGLMFWLPCFETPGKRYVTVTWPDGHTETFDFFAPTTDFFPNIGTAEYKPRANTTSRLEPMPEDGTFAQFNGNFYTDFFSPEVVYNPTRFKLTAKDGTKYVLDTKTGLVSATDRHDNTVTVDATGVHSSLGPSIIWTRDTQGRITALDGPATHVGYTYGADNNLATVTDPAGRTTTFDYLPGHYLHGITGPGNVALKTVTYTADGRVDTITDMNGHVTTVHDDPNARTEQVDRPDGRGFTRTTMDVRGNPLTVVETLDGVDHPSSFQYNALDLPTRRTDANGHSWGADYNAATGNLEKFTDANGHATTITYNEFAQPLVMTDVTNHDVVFTYDPATGDLVDVKDPDGHHRAYGYDGDGNLTSSDLPDHPAHIYTYFPDGKLRTHLDGNGQTTTYGYDAAGNLTSEARPEGLVTYGYNADRERTSMSDQTGTTTYTIDPLGRVTAVASPQGTITYGYVGAQRTSMTTPSASFTYDYDDAGQLDLVTGPAGNISLHNGWGGVDTITRPNGVVTTNTYDPAGRLTDIVHAKGATHLAEFHYPAAGGLDNNGNRRILNQTVNGQSWTETYGLDALDRLIDVTYSDTGQHTHYDYFPSGNRERMIVTGAPTGNGTTDYVYNASQELTSYTGPSGTRTLTYDGNGNQTSDGAGSNFSFDSKNRMIGTTGAVGNHAYAFDGSSQRVRADGLGQLWSDCGCAAGLPMLMSDGGTTQTWVNAQLVAQTAGSASTFPLTDALGSIRAVTDTSGAVVSTTRRDAFGAPRAASGSPSTFGYTGQQTDPTGLINLRARMYEPGTGRFLSADTAQPNGPGTQGLNLFGYVSGNPVSHVDPSGHDLFGYQKLTEMASRIEVALKTASVPFKTTLALCAVAIALAYWQDTTATMDALIMDICERLLEEETS